MNFKVVLVLLLCVTAYILVGAAVFHFLEYPNELRRSSRLESFTLNFLSNFTCVSPADFKLLKTMLSEEYYKGTDGVSNWNYASSVFFAITVVTTIGYGHIAPLTRGGRGFCTIYAIIGIPLMALTLVGIGETMAILPQKVKDRIFWPKHKSTERWLKTLTICCFGILTFIIIPSIIFSHMEEWGYLESFYFSVITLTTVGFGDFVAGQKKKTYRNGYKVLLAIWVFIGLSWVAMCLNHMGECYKSYTGKLEVWHPTHRKGDQESHSQSEGTESPGHDRNMTNGQMCESGKYLKAAD